jgi:primosomal protein N' (replication factor Y)
MIKIPSGNSLGATKKAIEKMLGSFDAVPQYRPVRVTINVDPY